jgi:hypothetical protein
LQAALHYQAQRQDFGFAYALSGEPFGLAQLGQFPVFTYRPAAVSWIDIGRNAWPLLWVAVLAGYRLGR